VCGACVRDVLGHRGNGWRVGVCWTRSSSGRRVAKSALRHGSRARLSLQAAWSLLYCAAAARGSRVAPHHALRHRLAYGCWCCDMGAQGGGRRSIGEVWVELAVSHKSLGRCERGGCARGRSLGLHRGSLAWHRNKPPIPVKKLKWSPRNSKMHLPDSRRPACVC
jgi:hypothetical protein